MADSHLLYQLLFPGKPFRTAYAKIFNDNELSVCSYQAYKPAPLTLKKHFQPISRDLPNSEIVFQNCCPRIANCFNELTEWFRHGGQ